MRQVVQCSMGMVGPVTSCRAISSRSSSRLMGISGSSRCATASSISSGLKAFTARKTDLMSGSRSAGTLRQTWNAEVRSMLPNTSPLLVVPTTKSFRPGGGMRFTSTSSVWSTALEKRGPMGTYSSSRSRSSSTMMDSVDLYASSKTLAMRLHLACSEKPTMSSLVMTFTKGNPLSTAMVAASAVVPLPIGPSSSSDTSGVFSLP
mmetsp:Transcript_40403/g.102268  ORF Transcript_40403/g.102268 Transcript_40403/m.102268 type:complete len:205 (-) Transcript_40403:330-944(-)